MTYKFLSVLFFVCLSLFSFCQDDLCGAQAGGVFWPIQVGVKKHYYTKGVSYVSHFNGDSLVVNGLTYFKELKEYSNGEKNVTYFREEKGNVYVYDPEKKVEFLEFSNNIIPGYTWEKYDHTWKYTIVDTTSSLTTPYCSYQNLLNIKAEPQKSARKGYASYFNLYYKRGMGLVGLDISGKPFSFLTIDASAVDEKSYLMEGCEQLKTNTERYQCTSEKIQEFIGRNFNYSGKLKKGIVSLQIIINERGDVEDVTVDRSLKNADGQTQEAIRVVKLLKFIPRQINGKPSKAMVMIPVRF